VDDPGALAVDVASFEVIFEFVAVLFDAGGVVVAGGAVDGGGAVVDAPSVTKGVVSSSVTPTSTSQLPFSHFSFVTKYTTGVMRAARTATATTIQPHFEQQTFIL